MHLSACRFLLPEWKDVPSQPDTHENLALEVDDVLADIGRLARLGRNQPITRPGILRAQPGFRVAENPLDLGCGNGSVAIPGRAVGVRWRHLEPSVAFAHERSTGRATVGEHVFVARLGIARADGGQQLEQSTAIAIPTRNDV